MIVTLLIALSSAVVLRRSRDLLTATFCAWTVSLAAVAAGPIAYFAIGAEALLVIAVSLASLTFGHWLGSRVSVAVPRLAGPTDGLWPRVDRWFIALAGLFLMKSVVLLLLQIRSGGMGLSDSLSEVRHLHRGRFESYLIYLSFADLVLCAVGGVRWRHGKALLTSILPVTSLYGVSLALGGRTYVFWGVLCFGVAAVIGHRVVERSLLSMSGRQLWARLAVAGLSALIAIESIRFARSGGTPYEHALSGLAPYTDATISDNPLSGFWLVSVFYWTSPIAAFSDYVGTIERVDVQLAGWLLSGWVNLYDLTMLRPPVYVPLKTNVYTWLPYFYEDFGWAGFAVMPMIIGALVGWHWSRLSRYGTLKYGISCALLSVVLLYSSFDYALGNRVFVWAVVAAVIL